MVTAFMAHALEMVDTIADVQPALSDTIYATDTANDSIKPKRNFIGRFLDYFKNANKPKEYKKFDFSVLGGPHFSSDTKLGIGVVAAGFYRPNLSDTLTSPSNVSLYGDVSTVGFYLVGIRGNHIFPKDNRRIDYNLYFYSFPRKFWGIGYENGLDMNNATKFNEIYIHASVDYLWRIYKSFFAGPALEYTYAHAGHTKDVAAWQGLPMHTSTYGIGGRLQYDTRDNFTAPQSGVLLALEQRFSPKFLGNKYAFSYTELKAYFCTHLWRGSVLATGFHAKANYGNVPWAMMATFGGSNTMRGYYEGRFRDKCEMDLTLELRQHVWRRNGIVVWGGAGSVFPKFSKFHFRHILPNCGIGYRWEFKQRTNVRIDYGLARGETAFIFSINEAF